MSDCQNAFISGVHPYCQPARPVGWQPSDSHRRANINTRLWKKRWKVNYISMLKKNKLKHPRLFTVMICKNWKKFKGVKGLKQGDTHTLYGINIQCCRKQHLLCLTQTKKPKRKPHRNIKVRLVWFHQFTISLQKKWSIKKKISMFSMRAERELHKDGCMNPWTWQCPSLSMPTV